MDSTLSTLLYSVLTLIVSVLGAFASYWIKSKAAQIKERTANETVKYYVDLAADAISTAVTYTSQTYVSSLKADNAFTKEAQQEAFSKALNAAKELLAIDTVQAIESIYGDIDSYLTAKIEAEVLNQKKAPVTE